MPLGSKVLEYQQTPTRSSSDLPRIVPSHRPAWVRIADPAAEHTRLSTASRANIEWLLQCFQADLACSLRSKPILACKAAADACAEGTKVGIGGWFISSRSKLFTTAWPLQIFVQLVAAWAYKHKWSVLASHIPGERNVCADQLSRGNTFAFDSKPQARFRFRPLDFWHQRRLSLHPPDAPWRPEHVSASQTL